MGTPPVHPRKMVFFFVLVLGSLSAWSQLVYAAEGSCDAGEDTDCDATTTCAADDEELIAKITKCVSASESYISCVTEAGDDTSANCACLGWAPDIQTCIGPCYALAKEGLCEGADAATLAAASRLGGADLANMDEAGVSSDGVDMEEVADVEAPVVCDLATAGELLQTCMPTDLSVLHCLQSGIGQCECFKKASVLIDCLGDCFDAIVIGVCPKERLAEEEAEEEEEDASVPCDDTDAADRLKVCATKDSNFESCMFADKSGEGECSCLHQSAPTLECFGRCKETILTGLECPPPQGDDEAQEAGGDKKGELPAGVPCDGHEASVKLTSCAKEDAAFVSCLQAGGQECDCVASAPVMLQCLGSCASAVFHSLGCTHSVVDAESSSNYGATSEPDGPDEQGPVDSCDAETAKAKLEVCAREDATYADCMKSNSNDLCFCVPNHPAIHECLGDCLGTLVEDVLKCDWGAEPGVIPACDKELAAAKLQECIARDPVVKTCVESDKLECDCIAESEITMACLENCLDLVNESLDCPLYGSPPAPPSHTSPCGAGNCCEADAAPKLQECAEKDATMVACLKSEASPCTCLSNSQMTTDCLGKCLDTINAILECPEHGSTRAVVPHTVGCTARYAAEKLKKCAAEDLAVLSCFKEGADAGRTNYQCACLQASDEMQACLAGCATVIGKSMNNCILGKKVTEQQQQTSEATEGGVCDKSRLREKLKSCVEGAAAEPNSSLVKCLKDSLSTKGSECECMAKSTFVHDCLGPACWADVQHSICEDVEEGTALVAESSSGGANNPSSTIETAAGGRCDSATATALATTCIPKDKDVLECLRKGGDECRCLQGSRSASLKRCFGTCWGPVHEALCSDANLDRGSDGSDGSNARGGATGVEHLLATVGLVDLWPVLRGEDVTDIETLADMTREDFKSMGISVGKASKIMRAVKKL